MRSIDEYRAKHPIQKRDKDNNVAEARMMAQEVVRLVALTGDEHWDHFLRYLEAAISAAKKHLAFEEAKLRDPNLVADDEIRKVRVAMIRITSRIETLEEVLLLPRYLKEHGDEAKRKLAEMQRDAA